MRTGRPKFPPGQAKAAPISLRLTPAERAAVELAAQRAGRKLSEGVRDVITAASQQTA